MRNFQKLDLIVFSVRHPFHNGDRTANQAGDFTKDTAHGIRKSIVQQVLGEDCIWDE
jgi:hypothetical protein